MPERRPEAVTLDGNPFTLLGPELGPGDRAPDFEVISPEFQPIRLADFRRNPLVLLSLSSLDTPVCDREAREISRRAGEIPEARILCVSVDMPFALARWCGASGVDNVLVGSDHRTTAFGLAYGTLIAELRQLSRAAFVVDPGGRITHAEYVREVGDLPDWEGVLAAATRATAKARESGRGG